MNHKKTSNLDQDLQHELDELKNNINDLKATLLKKVVHDAESIPKALHAGEEKIQEAVERNPLASLGFAAGIGFILGALLTSKK